MITLSDEQWQPIDRELFVGRRLEAVLELTRATSVNLHDAVEAVMDRFAVLRETQPHKFTVDVEGFWDNFLMG